MPNSPVAAVLRKFGVVAEESDERLESRSGAGIHAVRTADGQSAYLKFTPAAQGPDALAAARRELLFYRCLAPIAPVRSPELLMSADTDDGVAMLLGASGKPLPVTAWTPDMWATLGRGLASLHNMHVPAEANWGRPDALRQAMAEPDLPTIEAFWAPSLPLFAEIVSRRAELERWTEALPRVFIHGDCHTDNVTHSGESLILLDWQESGAGRPGSDLAFLNVRAVPAGVTTPPVLLDAYLRCRPHDRRTLELALLAEELAVFVFQWPPFAAFNSPTGIDRVRQRTRDLSERWVRLSERGARNQSTRAAGN
ncbi:aminoglycoside phosphotransferase family protein [Streptomyces sp. NPDC005566]|uniref:aminoglycoside phosphotransferase family protein n=1 Tax=Streptomyces sp. NPDC005566 TaxID=3156886 RepID=UPI0033BD7FD0